MNKIGKNKKIYALILLYIIICAALYVYVYVVPKLSGALAETAIAQHGTMQEKNDAQCILVRKETVITAENGGTVSYYITENEKTRRGVKIADVYPKEGSAKSYYMSETGYVSYYIDGLETVYTPDTLSKISPKDFEANLIVPKDTSVINVVDGGALYKQVSGNEWYMVLKIPKENKDNYQSGGDILVDFGDAQIKASVYTMSEFEDCWIITAFTDRYYGEFTHIRKTDVSVITKNFSGLVIPASALSEEEGTIGVYVKNINSKFVFTPVNILTESEDSVLVSETSFDISSEEGEKTTIYTIDAYDEILRDAGGLKHEDTAQPGEEEDSEEEEIVFEWEKNKKEDAPAQPEEGENSGETEAQGETQE